MKTLSLYVDKWFITVAVNIDGKIMPLSLPNGEDRIWLFFQEDIVNKRIVYGKDFEKNYRDRQPHYFGDIFNLIEQGDAHFTRYQNRPEEITGIFKVSNIFNDLHQAIDGEGRVDTYLSFSTDISDIARYKFIEELKEANFNVVESVARISYLALEESKKRSIFTEDGYYLSMVATNDNLHYALYEHTDGVFIRKEESSLLGLGLDVRRRALVESVVENVNRTARLLVSEDDFKNEYVRQERFANEWLAKINSSNPNIPIALGEVTFAVAPNNPYSVSVVPRDLNDRTKGIVDDIVRKIGEFIKNNRLQSHEISGIIFIGNTFTNQTFIASINNRFFIKADKIVTYREEELPKVVNIYTEIDCSQFKAATERFVENAKTQAILNQQAKEEEERRLKAQEENRRQQEERDSLRKAEQEYTNAIEYIERYENDRDYEQMIEWAEIALAHRPDSEYAKEKLALAQQLLAEQRANNKQFTAILQRAKTAFTEGRWADAIAQSENALEIKPEAEEARSIKNEAIRQLDIKEKVTNYLNRADVFFGQKLYDEALKEVNKILSLDVNNTKAKELKFKIFGMHNRHKQEVTRLLQALTEAEEANNIEEAIIVCEKLIEEDTTNLRRWTSKKEQLLNKQREIKESLNVLGNMRVEINKAFFNEEWQKLQLLCENYLKLSEDDEVLQILTRANERIESTKTKEAKEKISAMIDSLLIDRRFNEAEEELKKFVYSYPLEVSLAKDLRRKIFDFEMNTDKQKSNNSQSQQSIGFIWQEKTKEKDDFFADVKSKHQTKDINNFNF